MNEKTLEPWKTSWYRILKQDDAQARLAENLIERWRQNIPDEEPLGLLLDPISIASGHWWQSLELFLLDEIEQELKAEEATAILIGSFEDALEKMSPDISNGEVWVNDVLALRRVMNAKRNDRMRVARLLFYVLEKLNDWQPNSEVNTYYYTERLYSVIGECMVAENYEEYVVNDQLEVGARVTAMTDFSLFYLLEKDRLRLSEEGTLHENIDGDWEGFYFESDLIKKYQELVDSLFNTLKTLTAQVMDGESSNEKMASFDALLKRMSAKGRASLNNFGQFLGLQRMLDIHWRRLCHIVSHSLMSVAQRVIKFVSLIAKQDDYYGDDLKNCILSDASILFSKPVSRESVFVFVKQDGHRRIHTPKQIVEELLKQGYDLESAE